MTFWKWKLFYLSFYNANGWPSLSVACHKTAARTTFQKPSFVCLFLCYELEDCIYTVLYRIHKSYRPNIQTSNYVDIHNGIFQKVWEIISFVNNSINNTCQYYHTLILVPFAYELGLIKITWIKFTEYLYAENLFSYQKHTSE